MVKRRAAIYARFSSHNQRSESIEIQVDAGTRYIAENGLELVRVYADYAKTGRNTDRS
ncbi:MAG: recombinase family protein, partial [Eggerthellaceae bacterium]|nr:recombinase family protein [Eggerthellaceae bacterium]